ncbi:MAG: protein serine/threonine phosphatase [Streptosporangiaceae bacterium]|jgi:serine/threonine protein phosphatase PrpC|nr:protein serine/threonine phosphatase [Streptosporangiaceae bacterium]
MTIGIHYAARSDVGMLREGNEDSAYAGARLLVVADGMGGHVGGEIASAAAVETLRKLDTEVPAQELLAALERAVKEANDKLHNIVEGEPSLQGMGTTLTAMLWSGSHVALVHIGDSRAYLLRNGELFQITHDHTLVQSLVDEGRITLDEAASHPQRSLLLRALDGRGEVDPDLALREAQVGDRYLLCSDGLSGVVSAETIHQVLSAQAEPIGAIKQLIDLANRGGGPDNITCVIADVIDLTQQQPPAARPMLAGAAANAATPGSAPVRAGNTPAQRAAELHDTLPQPAVGIDGMPPPAPGPGAAPMHAAATPLSAPMPSVPPAGPPPAPAMSGPPPTAQATRGHGRGWTWLVAVAGVFILLVGTGVFFGYQYLRSGYYVGVGNATASKNLIVVVYTGKPDDVFGQKFSKKAPQDKQTSRQILVDDLDTRQQMAVKGNLTVQGPLNQTLQKVESSVCLYLIHPGGKNNTEVVVSKDPSQTTNNLSCPNIDAAPPRFDRLPDPEKVEVGKGIKKAKTDATSKINSLVAAAKKNCTDHPDLPACKGGA